MTIEREMPDEMQHHAQNQPVRGIAMHAAQHAADIPLTVGERLYRGKSAGNTGFKKCVEIQACRNDDPEQKISDCAEVVKRIEPDAKKAVEDFLDREKYVLGKGLQ